MKKIFKNEHEKMLVNYSIELIDYIKNVIVILDENYGANRDIDKDLGGYIVIAENIADIKIMKQDKI